MNIDVTEKQKKLIEEICKILKLNLRNIKVNTKKEASKFISEHLEEAKKELRIKRAVEHNREEWNEWFWDSSWD